MVAVGRSHSGMVTLGRNYGDMVTLGRSHSDMVTLSCGYRLKVCLLRLRPGPRAAEYLVAAEQDADHQQEPGKRCYPDGHVDKHQAAGENSAHQQPDCCQDNRKYSAEPEHEHAPLTRPGQTGWD
jgi:hypothetical protein